MLQEPELFAYSKAALLYLFNNKELNEAHIKSFQPILLYFSQQGDIEDVKHVIDYMLK
jgi:hypothetical protein